MRNRRTNNLIILLVTGLLLTGCGTGEKKEVASTENSQTQVVDEIISTEETTVEKTTEAVEESPEQETTDTKEENTTQKEPTEPQKESGTGNTNKGTASNDSIVQNSKPSNASGTTNAKEAALVKSVANSIITSGMSELEKVKAIHDWMVINLDYDYENFINDTIPTSSWKVEGVLTTKYAICEGYARVFNALCKEAGIESIYVMGDVPGGLHAWNQAKINGTWYNVDVCWDDPANRAFDDHSANRYTYFLISDAQMKDHLPKTQKNTCNSSLRDEVLKMHCPWRNYNYITTMEQMATVANTYVSQNASTILFDIDPKFQGSTNIYTLVRQAMGKTGVVDDYTISKITYTTDEWGIKHYTCYFDLKNGVFTKYNLVNSVEQFKQEILKLSTNTSETQYVFLTTEFKEQSEYLGSNEIQKWLYFDAKLYMQCGTYSPICDGVYKAHISVLRPITEGDEFIEHAYSYADVEAIVADRQARGMNKFTIRFHYDMNATAEEGTYAVGTYGHLINTQIKVWREKYGMSVNVSAQTTDTCFIFFQPAE